MVLMLAGALWAQRPAFVYVTAPDSKVVSGQEMAAKVSAADAGGVTLSNQAWTWSSSDESVLTVNGNGIVTAKLPGIADVIAVTSNVRGSVRLQVLPARVEVLPALAELAPGEQLGFTAKVFNSRGEELDGVALQWTVTGTDGFNNNGASIGRTGTLSAFGVGRYQVRAAVTYAVGPGQFVPQFIGSARAEVRQKSGWRLRRIAASTDMRDGMLLRSSPSGVAVSPDGLLAVSASLDGLANAIVTTRGGTPEVWAGSGTQGVRPGTVLMGFEVLSVNRRGEVATTGSTNGTANWGNGNNIVLVTREGVRFLTLAAIADAGVDFLRPQWTTRFSLNDSTQCAFAASYRDPVSRVDRVGLFMVDGDGFNQLLVPGDADLPGVKGAFTFDRDLAYDNAGILTFTISQGSSRHIFRRTTSGAYERIAGTGDKVGAVSITQANQVAISASGQLAYHLYTANADQYLALQRAGEQPRYLPMADLRQVYQVSNGGEVLYYGNGGAGLGLYGWNGTQSRTIALIGRLTPSEDPLTELIGASFGAGSDVIVHGVTPRRDLLVYRASPNPMVLLESGARTAGLAGLAFESLVLGARQGAAYLRTYYARSGAIDAGVPAIAMVAPGDRLPDGGRYDGGFLQRTPDGDLLLSTTTSLQRLSPAASRSLLRFPYSMDGGLLYGANLAAANRTGITALLTYTSFPSQRLVMVENGEARLIAHIGGGDPAYRTSSPTGGVFSANRQLWVDDNGRVIALMDVNGGPSGVFAYEQSGWKPLLLVGGKMEGLTITGIDAIRVAGRRVVARYATAGNFISVAMEDAAGWTRRFGRGDDSPAGNFVTFTGAFDVFGDDQLAVAFSGGGMLSLGVQRAGGDLRVLLLGNVPTDEDDLFTSIESIDARDDGRIYFTGFTAADRWVAYVAEPIQ
jgi:hypothetical protein